MNTLCATSEGGLIFYLDFEPTLVKHRHSTACSQSCNNDPEFLPLHEISREVPKQIVCLHKNGESYAIIMQKHVMVMNGISQRLQYVQNPELICHS